MTDVVDSALSTRFYQLSAQSSSATDIKQHTHVAAETSTLDPRLSLTLLHISRTIISVLMLTMTIFL